MRGNIPFNPFLALQSVVTIIFIFVLMFLATPGVAQVVVELKVYSYDEVYLIIRNFVMTWLVFLLLLTLSFNLIYEIITGYKVEFLRNYILFLFVSPLAILGLISNVNLCLLLVVAFWILYIVISKIELINKRQKNEGR